MQHSFRYPPSAKGIGGKEGQGGSIDWSVYLVSISVHVVHCVQRPLGENRTQRMHRTTGQRYAWSTNGLDFSLFFCVCMSDVCV